MGSDGSNIFWRNVALVTAFLVLTPIALIVSIISLISIQPSVVKPPVALHTNPGVIKNGVSVYASLPTNVPSITGHITVADARPQIVRQYLLQFGSPLVPFSEEIVKDADKYGIDFRFIPAIAQQESNLCHAIPPGSYNCWGWGITSVSSLAFDSYSDGIDTVTKGLKNNYIDEGLVTPEEIMTKYTPQSPGGAWAKGVNEFMSEMQ